MAHPVRLRDIGDARLDAYARLTEHQLRAQVEQGSGILIAESRLVVDVALAQGLEPVSFLVDEWHLDACADLMARTPDEVPAYVLPHELMEELIGYKFARGILAAFRRPRPRTVGEVVAGASNVAVVEDLVDVSNVGALFRSAAALGADAVVLSPRCADPLCRRALRVSMGTALQVPWARADAADWPARTVSDLRAQGFECLAMALEPDAVAIDDPCLARRADARRALFFGSEGFGLARATLDACDKSVVIPMAHGVDSLNVAASSAVAFWQLFR